MPPAFLLADPHVSHILSEEDINSYVAALGKSLFTTGMIVATAITRDKRLSKIGRPLFSSTLFLQRIHKSQAGKRSGLHYSIRRLWKTS